MVNPWVLYVPHLTIPAYNPNMAILLLAVDNPGPGVGSVFFCLSPLLIGEHCRQVDENSASHLSTVPNVSHLLLLMDLEPTRVTQ